MWSKANEMEYVNQLISGELWHTLPRRPDIPTAQILRNYITSARNRIAWGTYFPEGEEIISHAQEAVARLERRR